MKKALSTLAILALLTTPALAWGHGGNGWGYHGQWGQHPGWGGNGHEWGWGHRGWYGHGYNGGWAPRNCFNFWNGWTWQRVCQ